MSKVQKKISLKTSVTLFVFIQTFFMILIGLWIWLYLSDNEIYPSLNIVIIFSFFAVPEKTILILCGLILTILNSGGTYFLFHKLIRQTKINHMYDDFINNITHDLKTPVASIQLIGETLSNRGISDYTYFDFLNRLENDTTRLKKLINSILEISRIQKKRDMFSSITLTADHFVRTAVRVLQSQFNLDKDNISVIGYSKCRIRIDPSAFTAILSNLIDNSIKYSTSPVKIKIYLGYKKKKFILIFSDEGRGISRKYRKRVFKKYVQIRMFPNSRRKGLGIGLNWCKEILHIHKGRIQVQRNRNRKGTSFYIELPGDKLNNLKGEHIE